MFQMLRHCASVGSRLGVSQTPLHAWVGLGPRCVGTAATRKSWVSLVDTSPFYVVFHLLNEQMLVWITSRHGTTDIKYMLGLLNSSKVLWAAGKCFIRLDFFFFFFFWFCQIVKDCFRSVNKTLVLVPYKRDCEVKIGTLTCRMFNVVPCCFPAREMTRGKFLNILERPKKWLLLRATRSGMGIWSMRNQ